MDTATTHDPSQQTPAPRRAPSARPKRRVAALAATGVSALLGVTALGHQTALAADPVVVEDAPFVEREVVPAGDLCEVEVVLEVSGRVRVTEWYEKDGAITKAHLHIQGVTQISSAYGSGVNRWIENAFLDPSADTVTRTGNSFNVHSGPGGVLVNDSGRVVLDFPSNDLIVSAGPRATDFSEICARLSPR